MGDFVNYKRTNNDLLSQSYSESIARITGNHKDIPFDFYTRKLVLEHREQTWDQLFKKYSEETKHWAHFPQHIPSINKKEHPAEMPCASDDFELIFEDVRSEESTNTHISEQPISMRKSSAVVQYWVDTGNPPCNAFNNENSDPEICSSLTESASPLNSPITNKIPNIHGFHQDDDSISSCSSVDTAVYILSNTNITRREQIASIVKGAKDYSMDCTPPFNESTEWRDVQNKMLDVQACIEANKTVNDVTTHIGELNKEKCIVNVQKDTISTDNVLSEGSRSPAPCTDSDSTSIMELCLAHIADAIQERQLRNNTLACNKTAHTVNGNVEKLQGANISTNPLVDNVEEHLIFTKPNHINHVKKKLIEKDNLSDQTCSSQTTFNSLSSLSQVRKLYSGSDSPVDLMPINKFSTNRISQISRGLHPALEPEDAVTVESAKLIKKKKRSAHTLHVKNNIIPADVSRKSSKHCNGTEHLDTQCSVASMSDDSSLLPLSTDALYNPIDASTSILKEDAVARIDATSMNNLINSYQSHSVNLNPIVLLTRLSENDCTSYMQQNSVVLAKENNILLPSLSTLQHSVDQNKHKLKNFRQRKDSSSSVISSQVKNVSVSSEIENIDVELDSDHSTIFICECSNNEAQNHSVATNCAVIQNDERTNITVHTCSNEGEKLESTCTVRNESLCTKTSMNPFVRLECLKAPEFKKYQKVYRGDKGYDVLHMRNDKIQLISTLEKKGSYNFNRILQPVVVLERMKMQKEDRLPCKTILTRKMPHFYNNTVRNGTNDEINNFDYSFHMSKKIGQRNVKATNTNTMYEESNKQIHKGNGNIKTLEHPKTIFSTKDHKDNTIEYVKDNIILRSFSQHQDYNRGTILSSGEEDEFAQMMIESERRKSSKILSNKRISTINKSVKVNSPSHKHTENHSTSAVGYKNDSGIECTHYKIVDEEKLFKPQVRRTRSSKKRQTEKQVQQSIPTYSNSIKQCENKPNRRFSKESSLFFQTQFSTSDSEESTSSMKHYSSLQAKHGKLKPERMNNDKLITMNAKNHSLSHSNTSDELMELSLNSEKSVRISVKRKVLDDDSDKSLNYSNSSCCSNSLSVKRRRLRSKLSKLGTLNELNKDTEQTVRDRNTKNNHNTSHKFSIRRHKHKNATLPRNTVAAKNQSKKSEICQPCYTNVKYKIV